MVLEYGDIDLARLLQVGVLWGHAGLAGWWGSCGRCWGWARLAMLARWAGATSGRLAGVPMLPGGLP